MAELVPGSHFTTKKKVYTYIKFTFKNYDHFRTIYFHYVNLGEENQINCENAKIATHS